MRNPNNYKGRADVSNALLFGGAMGLCTFPISVPLIPGPFVTDGAPRVELARGAFATAPARFAPAGLATFAVPVFAVEYFCPP